MDAVHAVIGTQLTDVGSFIHGHDTVLLQFNIQSWGDVIGGDGAPQSLQLKAEFLWGFTIEADHAALGGGQLSLGRLDKQVGKADLYWSLERLRQVHGSRDLDVHQLEQCGRSHRLHPSLRLRAVWVSDVLDLVLPQVHRSILEVNQGAILDGHALRRGAADCQFGHGTVIKPLDFSRNDHGEQPLFTFFYRDVDKRNAIGCRVFQSSIRQRSCEFWPLCAWVALCAPRNDAGLSGLDDKLCTQDAASVGCLVGAKERVLAHGHFAPISDLNVPSSCIDLFGEPTGCIRGRNGGPEGPVNRTGGRVELDLPARVLC